MARTAERVLKLLSLLQNAGRWGGPELAARLGVSLRTVRRDVDTLRQLGFPVQASGGRHSTYHLGSGSTLPPLVLDDEQATAISVALQSAPMVVLGLRDAAQRALATLAQVMPAPLRAHLDATRVTTLRNYWEFPAPPIALDILNAVGNAVRKGHLLQFDVLRPDRSRPDPGDADFVPPLRVEPHHLVLWAGRWYLVAYTPTVAAWVIHRVDRIHAHMATGVPFVRRELIEDNVADFVMSSPDRGDTPEAWPCLGSVVLALPADVVARFAPGGSVIERLDAERTRLTLGAWSWAGVAGILATFDAALTEVEPAELINACHATAARLGGV